MKGLEISRKFFFEWGLPFIEREYPHLAKRIAAGRVSGSDAIGVDDKWSRDHDWGPRFRLWLNREDYRRLGRRLGKHINQASPETFMGVCHNFFGAQKNGIVATTIDSTCKNHLGRAHPPKRERDWFRSCPGRGESLVDRESWLYFFKHGPIFCDLSGEVTARKSAFAEYPKDVQLRVISDLCRSIWADGEYKFSSRFIHRRDPFVNYTCLSDIVQSVMRLWFILGDDYAPHTYWRSYQFRRLPDSGPLQMLLENLLEEPDLGEKVTVINAISDLLREKLIDAGILDRKEVDRSRYLGDVADAIKRKIADPWIREM